MNNLSHMTDIPDIYRNSILKWKRELDIRPFEPPSTVANPNEVTKGQLYLYDLMGFLVIRGALNPDQVKQLRESVGYQFARAGRENRDLLDVSFDAEWGQDWINLIDNPSLLPILLHIFNGKPKLDHAFTVRSTFGNKEGQLHHQGYDMRKDGFFHDVQDGRISNGLVGVIYSLYNNDDTSGGFCCVPGSHKTNFPTPAEYFNVFANPAAKFVPVRAGDALLFNEALTHGTTLPMEGGIRHAIMTKFTPGWMQYRLPVAHEIPAKTAGTINHEHDSGEANVDPNMLTARQKAILTPAYSRRRPTISVK